VIRPSLLGVAARSAWRARHRLAPLWIASLVWFVGGAICFGALHILHWSELPFPEPHELVQINAGFEIADDLRGGPLVEAISNFSLGVVDLEGPAGRATFVAAGVDADFFRVLGVRPMAGRFFDRASASEPGIVLSVRAHRRLFASPTLAPGDALRLGKGRLPLLGTVENRWSFPIGVDAWVLERHTELRDRRFLATASVFGTIARLSPDMPWRTAAEQIVALDERLSAERGLGVGGTEVVPLERIWRRRLDALVALVSGWLGALYVFFVLAITMSFAAFCLDHIRDFAIHASVGARRIDLLTIVLGHLVLVSAPGLVTGLPLGWLALGALERVLPAEVVGLFGHGLGLRSLGAALFAWSGALVAAALAATALVAAAGEKAVLRPERVRSTIADRREGRLRLALAIPFLAVAGAMLWTSALLEDSHRRASSQPLGFEPRGVGVAVLRVSGARLEPGQPRTTSELLRVIEARLPSGLAALSDFVPFGAQPSGAVSVRDADSQVESLIATQRVSPDYFRTLGIPLVAGSPSGFSSGSRGDRPPCALDVRAAEELSPDRSPLGHVLELPRGACVVEAVVGPVRDRSLEQPMAARAYLPLGDVVSAGAQTAVALIFRPQNDALSPVAALGTGEISEDAVVERVDRLEDLVGAAGGRRRLMTRLTEICAAGAALLAIATIYGVFAWELTARRRELAVRFALGETPQTLLRSLVGKAGRLTAIAALLAAAFCVPLAFFIRGALFESRVTSFSAIAAGVLLFGSMMAVGAGAAIWRAMRWVANEGHRNLEL
jgi:hypothetical protein